MADAPIPTRLRFHSFELDRRSGELLKGGSRLRLQEAPLKVLQALLDRPGEIVTRDELRARLWPDDTFVDFDNGLNTAVNRLRGALGDSADKPKFIETVGRRGYRFIAPLSAPESSASTAGRLTTSASVPMRLAVLPFRQLKADADTEFLTFSLADAVASSLSGLESIAVRSTIAAARFASDVPDLPAMAAALDVTLVLAGTVLRVGDRVRVTTQLVEAPRGTLLWTTTVEAALDDMFRVTDGLVRRIVESLALPLTVRDARQLDTDAPGSGRAYELYLRANGLGGRPDTWPQARELYGESVRTDPQYAPAWARLGRTYRMMAKYSADEDPQLARLAEESFRRALAINPELSLAHHLYAQLEMETGRSHEAFVRLLDRAGARRTDPQLLAALVQACRYVGLLDVSRLAHELARRLNPAIKTSVGYTSMMAGDYEQAVADARDNDDSLEPFALAVRGRTAEAAPMLRDLRQRYGTNRTWALYIDFVLGFATGDRDAFISNGDACLRTPFGDPDGIFFSCLLFAMSGDSARTLHALRRTVAAGFACPTALALPAIRHVLHDQPEFGPLCDEVERRNQRALRAFETAGGAALLRFS